MDKNLIISCLFCKKKLVNIIIRGGITAPDPISVVADCPFCGGQSQMVELKGKLCYGPIGKDESNYPTIIEDIDQVENLFKIKVKKNG